MLKKLRAIPGVSDAAAEGDSTRARATAAATRAEEEVGSPLDGAPQAITVLSTDIGNDSDTDIAPDGTVDRNTGAASSTEPKPAKAKAISDTTAADRAAFLEASYNVSCSNLSDCAPTSAVEATEAALFIL